MTCDSISGLTPRYKPETALPDGAVLVYQGSSHDFHWTPDGVGVAVDDNNGQSTWACDLAESPAAARALGLPLAGEELKEGEEAYTYARLDDLYRPQVGEEMTDTRQWFPHCIGATWLGLNNLRRWGNHKIGGWVCRKVEDKTEPTIEQQLRDAGATDVHIAAEARP